jgi:hypothetical protein
MEFACSSIPVGPEYSAIIKFEEGFYSKGLVR